MTEATSSRKIGSSDGFVEEWERHPLQRNRRKIVIAVLTEKEGLFHVISLSQVRAELDQ
jgi:hypothetical protein